MAAGFKTATVRSGDVPATQTDFPTYVDLDRLGITTLAEAESIRVYADEAKTTEWAREIVSATEMHVKIPSLTSSTEIFVDWDGVRSDYAVGATYGRNAVWTGYEMVLHMNGAAATDIDDSTGEGNDVSASGGTPVFNTTGKIDKAVEFARTSSEFISVPDSASLSPTAAINISMWTKPTSDSPAQGTLLSKRSSSSYAWELNNESSAAFRLRINGNANLVDSSTNPVSGTWYYVVGSYDKDLVSNNIKMSVNGVNEANRNYTTAITDNTVAVAIARRSFIGAEYYADAVIDEVRIASDVKGDNWNLTEYNNQNDEATFWGTWTDAGGGAAQTARRGVVMMM